MAPRVLGSSLRVLLVLLAAGACEADSEPEDAGAPVAASELCARLAGALCARDAACCARSDEARCLTTQRQACETSLGRLARDPRLGYSPSRGGALVARVESATACGADPLPWADVLGVFAGTGASGADCTPASTDGATLLASSRSCAQGGACRVYLRADGSAEGVCEVRAGDACSHPRDCPSDRWCSLPGAWRPGVWGTCRPLRANGWTCGGDLECASRSCAPSGVCAARGEGALCATRSYAELVRGDRPLALLRLGDVSSSRASDASGHGRDGEVVGDVGSAPSGALRPGDDDGAARFNGSARGRVELARVGEAIVDRASLELWLRLDDTDGGRPVAEFWGDPPVVDAGVAGDGGAGDGGAGDGGAEDGGARVDAGVTEPGAPGLSVWTRGSRLVVDLVDGAGASHRVESAEGALVATRWHHVVVTWNGALGRVHLDGASIGQTDVSSLRLAGALRVGYRGASGGSPAAGLSGDVDELALYDVALPESVVRTHREAGALGLAPSAHPAWGWLR